MGSRVKKPEVKRSSLTQQESDFVGSQRLGHLATAAQDGSPHVVPVCYAHDGSRFYTPLDEKPKLVADLQLARVRNILADPRVALVIDRYDEDWSRLAYILIRGQAQILASGEHGHELAVELLRDRYRQYQDMPLDRHPIIAIAPDRVISWGRISD